MEALLARVVPGYGPECVLWFPGDVRVGGAVAVSGRRPDEAEAAGVEIVHWVVVVGHEWRGEGEDECAVDAGGGQ